MRIRPRASILAGLALMMAVMAGCGPTAGPHPSASPAPHSTGATGASRASVAPASPDVRDELVLRADLSARAEPLTEVVRLPFGSGVDGLGLIDDPHQASRPVFPASFTVAPDGSFWLIDEAKHRLAHFDSAGRYLGQIGGLRFDRFHPQPQDLVAFGDALFLLEQDHQHFLLSYLREYRAGQLVGVTRPPLSDGDGPQVIGNLVSGSSAVVGLARGQAGDGMRLGEGRNGYALLSTSGATTIQAVDGIPLDHGPAVSGTFDPDRPDDRYLLSAITPRSTTVFPLRFVATPTGAEDAKNLLTGAGFQMQAVVGQRVAVWVQVSPSRAVDAERYGGGVWLLVFPFDGSTLIWQRLPQPGLSSEAQVRTLAAGPHGSLYVMLAARDAMVIYRVPGT